MDEVIFRSTRRLESIQMQAEIAASRTKDLLGTYSQQGKALVIQTLNSEKFGKLKENILELVNFLVHVTKNFSTQVMNTNITKDLWIFMKQTFGGKWTRREVSLVCAGFLVGSVVGVAIGVALRKKDTIIRYMQAIQVNHYLGPESVVVAEDSISPYECGDYDILINVKAASVHVIDSQICCGYGRNFRKILRSLYNEPDLPVILGRDCSGIITDLGKKVKRLEIGDEVWVTVPFWCQGTLCQTVLVSENRVAHKPKNVGFEGACSIPYAGSLALSALSEASIDSSNAKYKRFLIQSGCTPVGSVLIQLLVHWKAKITTTCYQRAVPVAQALGVTEVVTLEDSETDEDSNNFNPEKEGKKFLKLLRARGELYDVIILTKDYKLNLDELKGLCAKDGRILVTYPQKLLSDSGGFITRWILTFFIGLRLIAQDEFEKQTDKYDEAHLCYVTLDRLTELVEDGVLQTVVDKVFQPKDIEIALNHIQSSLSIGSTIVTFR